MYKIFLTNRYFRQKKSLLSTNYCDKLKKSCFFDSLVNLNHQEVGYTPELGAIGNLEHFGAVDTLYEFV